MKGKFQIFPVKAETWGTATDQWYWRYRSRNGKSMAGGGEPFTSVSNAKRSIKQFCTNLGLTGEPVIEVRKR